MNWMLVLGGVALLLVPGVLARLNRRFTPTAIVNLNRGAVIAGYGFSLGGLTATSAPALLRELGLTRFAIVCERVLGHLGPSHPVVALLAAVFGLWFWWSAIRGLKAVMARLATVRVERELGRHFPCRGLTLVLLPGEGPLAYAVPGRHPQIVVSGPWWRRLSPSDRRVVLHHEMGHIGLSHGIDLVLIETMHRSLGRIRWIRDGLSCWQLAMEQSADGAAASRCGRAAVAQALRRLVADGAGPALAFDGADTVAGRLEYLDRGDPPGRAAAIAVGLVGAVSGTAAVSAAIWLVHAHSAVVGLVMCPL